MSKKLITLKVFGARIEDKPLLLQYSNKKLAEQTVSTLRREGYHVDGLYDCATSLNLSVDEALETVKVWVK